MIHERDEFLHMLWSRLTFYLLNFCESKQCFNRKRCLCLSKYICGLCCMEFLGSENICANLNKFSHIFPFKLQRGSQAQRVSLNEWELNGKLAHQNTSQLPNNRKRPCKLGPLLAKLCFCSQRHILVLRLKTFFTAVKRTPLYKPALHPTKQMF